MIGSLKSVDRNGGTRSKEWTFYPYCDGGSEYSCAPLTSKSIYYTLQEACPGEYDITDSLPRGDNKSNEYTMSTICLRETSFTNSCRSSSLSRPTPLVSRGRPFRGHVTRTETVVGCPTRTRSV